MVAQELRTAWVARMRYLLGVTRGQTVLLWFAHEARRASRASAICEGEPLFVDRTMIDDLPPAADAGGRVATPSAAALARATEGMIFSSFEACAAAEQLGAAGASRKRRTCWRARSGRCICPARSRSEKARR